MKNSSPCHAILLLANLLPCQLICGWVPLQVSNFVCGIAISLLDVPALEAAQAMQSSDLQTLVKTFAEDKDLPVLLVVAWSAGRPSGRLGLFAGIPNDWRAGDAAAMAATLIKNAPTLDGSQPLAQQLQILSLGAAPLVDAIHAYVHRTFKPLLDSHFSFPSAAGPAGGGQGGTVDSSSNRDAMGATLVRKKVAELELALRGCQQEVKVADVVLHEHFAPEVVELTGALTKCGSQQEREDAKVGFLNTCKASEKLKKELCNSIVACHKELADLAACFDRRMVSSADMTPATERDFWLRMEEVMKKVDEQVGDL